MKSNRSLQGRLQRHRLALPPQRPPPQDPFPDLSLVLEDNVEVIEPFVQPFAASHKKDDIHAFYRSIETNEIPKEHVEEYYIPLLTQIFIPTDEIATEAIEWINERVEHAKERGVKMINPIQIHQRVMDNVAETHKERIEKFEIPEEHVEEYYIPLLTQTLILDKIAREVIELGTETGFSVADFRDVTKIGRNVAIEILEYFDNKGFTRRDGNSRKVFGKNPFE